MMAHNYASTSMDMVTFFFLKTTHSFSDAGSEERKGQQTGDAAERGAGHVAGHRGRGGAGCTAAGG